jgi:hypothetical protein
MTAAGFVWFSKSDQYRDQRGRRRRRLKQLAQLAQPRWLAQLLVYLRSCYFSLPTAFTCKSNLYRRTFVGIFFFLSVKFLLFDLPQMAIF